MRNALLTFNLLHKYLCANGKPVTYSDPSGGSESGSSSNVFKTFQITINRTKTGYIHGCPGNP